MKLLKPTMMDVAAKAGVSQATVSLILNGSPGARFSEDTRLKVREAAQALGYRLTQRGPVQMTSAANLIVFVVDELTSDPWMALAFEGARERALERGVSMSLAVCRNANVIDDDLVRQYSQIPVVGFIYGTMLTREISSQAVFPQAPTVLLNCYDAKRRLPSVMPGDLEGGRTATQQLIDSGRKRIGFINGQEGIDASSDRLRGYRQALASNDISFDPALVYNGTWEPPSGYDGTRAFLALDTPPDAIFCANDMMAAGCYDALKEAGLRIPQDMAVIGFDNREIAQFMRPPLTSLILPHYEMGVAAADQILDIAAGLTPRHNQIKVECELIERESI
ncbi:LacI family DNA-binding transcriptional regulator [Pararhodobacter zhoushanensis]|uniref:LacI family DNA-binding transcriptional regulator n=1 Tax=Pararhodobacter zhoushanensis TaxID=2479545 RepID=A0ABT3GWQ6_9RHOB|nr:LacI family DNA-binding transcriptional regulator [Pararhodobacter zhoushanensis]MCW1931971.1 LacI family DNA-binding transcriptional regulator [Pararhodobacter zhoushanensis]